MLTVYTYFHYAIATRKQTRLMSTPNYCSCLIQAPSKPVCVVSTPPNSAQPCLWGLVCTENAIVELRRAGPMDNGLMVGQPKPIRIRDFQQPAPAAQAQQAGLICACWDPFCGCLFAGMGAGVVRVSENGDATIIAGHITENGNANGLGSTARFSSCSSIFSDGGGCLYVISASRLRKLQLPSSWQLAARTAETGTVAAATALGNNHQQSAEGQPLSREPGGATGHASTTRPVPREVVVSAVLCGELDGLLSTGAYDPLRGSLVLCTTNLVYRLYTSGGAGAAAAAAVAAAAAAEPEPGASSGTGRAAAATEGAESSNEQPAFVTDVGDENLITGVAVDGTGSTWVADMQDVYEDVERLAYLHRLDADGGKCLVASGLDRFQGRWYTSPAVLHNGCLAMVSWADTRHEILLLHLELPPPALPGPTSRSLGRCSNTFSSYGVGSSNRDQYALSSDLAALLDRQPDSSADVEVEVGGQVFAAHRSVLAARSPYLAQRLDPGAGFADTGASRLSLPDADPRVFGAVLRYMYTDSTGPVAPELLQPVGELADRLLLPGLCAQVGRQLLLQVRPDNVVGLLLWAEQRRGSFAELLLGLKAWFLGQHAAGGGRGWVLPDREVVRLMREGPEELAVELMYHLRPDVRQCKRPRGL